MTLAEQLTAQTREGELYEKLDRNRVRCYACGHACPIPPGFDGVCKVRFNRDGKLYVPWGYVNRCSATPSRRSRSSTPCPARAP